MTHIFLKIMTLLLWVILNSTSVCEKIQLILMDLFTIQGAYSMTLKLSELDLVINRNKTLFVKER